MIAREAPIQAVVAIALIVLLAGCTPAACDPSQAEFFSGVGCAVSGSYGARESELRTGVTEARANALEQQLQADRARADQASAQQELARHRNQLALLDGRLRELRRQLDLARQRQGINQDAVKQAEQELRRLQNARSTVSPTSTDADLHALEAPTRELDQRLDREGLR